MREERVPLKVMALCCCLWAFPVFFALIHLTAADTPFVWFFMYEGVTLLGRLTTLGILFYAVPTIAGLGLLYWQAGKLDKAREGAQQ